jgi:glycosyltransferase involved in cell wall biosynthesis
VSLFSSRTCIKKSAPSVLFLAQHLGGGIGGHMLTLAEGLTRHGWEVIVCSSGKISQNSAEPEHFEARGVRHVMIPFPARTSLLSKAVNAGRAFAAVDRCLSQTKSSILHVHWRSVSAYAQFASLTRGVPFVSTLHLEKISSGRMRRLASFWGERAIAISRETKEALHATFGVPEARIRVIHNGIDACYFRPPSKSEREEARREFGLKPEQPVVAFVGRTSPVKRHDLLIRAIAILRARGLEVTALCAGGGRGREALSEQAAQAGVGDLVRFIGFADSRKVLWAADVKVLPSDYEGFPLAIVEAMLCGVVPLRTPAGGAYEQIDDGVSGFIVPFDDPEALAGRLMDILSDQALKERLAAAALVKARGEFTREKMIENTVKVYEEVLASRTR